MSEMVTVEGTCPSCKNDTLFVGTGGYITCSWTHCPDPTLVTDYLEQMATIRTLVDTAALTSAQLSIRSFGSSMENGCQGLPGKRHTWMRVAGTDQMSRCTACGVVSGK